MQGNVAGSRSDTGKQYERKRFRYDGRLFYRGRREKHQGKETETGEERRVYRKCLPVWLFFPYVQGKTESQKIQGFEHPETDMERIRDRRETVAAAVFDKISQRCEGKSNAKNAGSLRQEGERVNLNEILKEVLAETGLPVDQDEHTGGLESYIIFTYEDEKPVFHGDNKVLADTVYLQIQLITPKEFNYFGMKKKIKNLLENAGFRITSTYSFLGSVYYGTEKRRQTVFKAEYTQTREE